MLPYFTKKRQYIGLTVDQRALIILDVFTGHMAIDVKEVIETHNLIVVDASANMNK